MECDKQAASDAHAKARHDSFQWFEAFESLATARNSLMRIYGDRSIMRWDAEPLALLQDAANQLSKFVSIAKKKRDEANAEIERAKAILWPPTKELSDAEFAELGERMAADPSKIISNTDGAAYRSHLSKEASKRVETHGCCGGKCEADGYCPDYYGKCPRHAEATSATAFCEGYLKWLDDVQEQSGLAAVAARLSDPVFPSEVSNV